MKLRVLAEAEAELFAATTHYEGCQEGLGQDFYERVHECMDLIAQQPLRFPIYEGQRRSGGLRRARLERFPYIVVYKVLEKETLIVAVAHASRRPGYWKNRVE